MELSAGEIDGLVAKLGEVTGRELTAENLARAIREVNAKRRALQRLNATRRAVPTPISGKDALLATQVAFYDDVPRYSEMVNKSPTKSRPAWAPGKGLLPRTRRVLRQNIVGLLRHAAECVPAVRRPALLAAEELQRRPSRPWLEAAASLFEEAVLLSGDSTVPPIVGDAG